MYVPAYFGKLRIQNLFQLAIAMHQQQPLLPSSQPVAAIAGLQHTERTIGSGEIQTNGFELIMQSVQTLYVRRSPISYSPYLVIIIHQHLGHHVFGGMNRIMLMLSALDIILPYPLPHR